MKQLVRGLMLLWMLSASLVASAQTYTYAYMPEMGKYTDTGSSGSTSAPAIDYRNSSLAGGMDDYANGQIKTTLYSRNSTNGTLTFRIKKVGGAGYFSNGNSGKIFIWDMADGTVYATSWSITNATTSYIDAKVPNYGDFNATRHFKIFLITSNLTYKQYGGEIVITGSKSKLKPTINTTGAIDITSSSATLCGEISSNGSSTTYWFEYVQAGSSSKKTTSKKTVSATASQLLVKASVSGLLSNTNYEYSLKAENEGGSASGGTATFTTQTAPNDPPTLPDNPNPYSNATGVPTSGTLSWRCTDPDGDRLTFVLYFGTSSNPPIYDMGQGTSYKYEGLAEGTKYYWHVEMSDGKQTIDGPRWSFTTVKTDRPSVSIRSIYDITDTSVKILGAVNPNGLDAVWYYRYGTTSDYGSRTTSKTVYASSGNSDAEVLLTNLSPGTTYHCSLYAYNSKGEIQTNDYTFQTTGTSVPDTHSPFSDVTPDHCGSTNYGKDIYEAAVYLYNKGIIEGADGKLLPDEEITRAQLAKLALYALYGGEKNVPSTLVSDNFPSIYADLQNTSSYYYRAAKALLYLEYKDGRSPFDRNRSAFYPDEPIERSLVMKVLCETFNIAPLSSSSTPFIDFTSAQGGWGYAAMAHNLGITTTKEFKPFTHCTRGDAFLFAYRILTGGRVSIPKPDNTESYATSDFFIPANYKPANVNSLRGMASGNFNYYEKDFFNIDGYVPLGFGVTYNSCLTEMPSDFYPVLPMGTAWSHSYNAYMNVIEGTTNSEAIYVIHNHDGSMLMYDSALKSLSEGNYLTLSKISSSKYQVTTPTKTVYTFERYSTSDGIFYLTRVSDIHGTEKTISYENGNSHRRIAKVSALGRSLTFSYQSGTDLLKSVTDPSGRTVNFYYTNSLLSSLTDAKGQKTSFNYGTSDAESGLLKTITLPRGNTITNKYQQRKLTSTQTNSSTPTTVKISSSYANGTTTSQVTQPITNSKSLTTNYTMDANGNMTSAIDNESTDISITYGDSNNPTLPTKLKNNLTGVSSTITYNSYGLPTSTKITGGGISMSTSTTYNSDNQVTSSTDANGNTTRFSYSNGALTSVTDALGNVTRFTNNSYGSPTQITDACGRKLDITYNSYGNMTSSTVSALGISNSFVYDAISRITESTDGNGNSSTYIYDKNDNLLSVTDPKSNTISYKYDANDNLTGITNAKGCVTSLTYDDDDLLIGQSFQGHDKSFTYYDSGALKTSTSADGTTFSYTYDEAGRVTDNDYATFSYNSKGQLTYVEKDGKEVGYYYDGLGRTSSVEYDGKEVSYEYDNNGNATAITYPGGNTVYYTYDALNRVTAVTDWNGAKTTYSYNADGSLDYMQLPNKVKTTYSYDNGGRLVGVSTKRSNGSTIVGYGYTLDDNGNHISVEVNDVFDHDPILVSEDITYSYNGDNRITNAGDISFDFDDNGNTTSRSGRTMRYDKANNLTSVSGDFNASYTYDGLGQRRSATRDGVTTKYVLSGSNVVAETNGSGTVQYYYVYGPTGLISRISASGDTRYYVADARGSIVAMTDASTSANLTHKYQYDEFGKVTSAEEEDLNRFRYVGNKGVMYEAENLTFMRARYYDESIGRFLSEDPIWSTNLYPYCSNNPITVIDPSGNIGEILGETMFHSAEGFVREIQIELTNLSSSVAQAGSTVKTVVVTATRSELESLKSSIAVEAKLEAAYSEESKYVTNQIKKTLPQTKSVGVTDFGGTIIGGVVGATQWDGNQPFASVGNVVHGMTVGLAGDTAGIAGGGFLGRTAASAVTEGAIWGAGKIIDATPFEDWCEKGFEKIYVKNYLIR